MPKRILNSKQIIRIRNAVNRDGRRACDVAKSYGISESTVSRIANRKMHVAVGGASRDLWTYPKTRRKRKPPQ